MRTILSTIFLALALAGCSEEKRAEATRDVDYYLAHRAEHDAKLAECKNNPGELAMTANCANARQADKKRFIEEGRKALNR